MEAVRDNRASRANIWHIDVCFALTGVFLIVHGKSVERFTVEREVTDRLPLPYLYLKQLSSEGTAFALRCSNDVELWVPSPVGAIKTVSSVSTVEPRQKEGPRDWQNLFDITRFRYNEVLFHSFCCYWDKENCSSYEGLRYVEFRYIKVPLYFRAKYVHTYS